jgi:hypothetical protein
MFKVRYIYYFKIYIDKKSDIEKVTSNIVMLFSKNI